MIHASLLHPCYNLVNFKRRGSRLKLTNAYRHIYLSPHYDDASLSCGGTIHKQVQAGQSVLVITICAAPPPAHEPLSPFAQKLHQNWGSPEDVVATRRAEDEVSMGILGVGSIGLDFTDCIYRGQAQHEAWYYNNDAELFGKIHPDDVALSHEIARVIVGTVSQSATVTLYAPLTVGHHVDHQLVHVAALRLQSEGWGVVFYEDYPYVDPGYMPHGQNNPYDLEVTLARLEYTNLQPQVQRFSEEDLQAKVESIAAYGSQLQVLFGGQANMEMKVRNYALSVGQGSPAERIWLPG